jgi:AcrR family transcriptional regulator
MSSVETRVLDAVKACCERWGYDKVTIDDIAAAARVSRATIYRMFPGGKDVLFEALRVRELEEFFALLLERVEGATGLEDLLVRAVVAATEELRADEHLALALASEPGTTLGQLTVEGLPRIIRFANAFLAPLADPYIDRDEARAVIDVLARLTISYFLAPSDTVDLGDPDSARALVRPFLTPHLTPHHTQGARA